MAQILTKVLKPNRLQNLYSCLRLLVRNENQPGALAAGLSTKPPVIAYNFIAVAKRNGSGCGICVPPKKKKKSKCGKPKPCSPQCPLQQDPPKPPCPLPGRPPMPDKCKDKWVVKKYKTCPKPCPPPKEDPCNVGERPCDD